MIDKILVLKRFQKSARSYDQNAVVQSDMAEKLVRLISESGRNRYANILEVGSGTGLLTRKLKQTLTFETFYTNDLVPDSCAFVQSIIPNAVCIPGDAENETFPGNLDLVVSNAVFQWFEDLQPMLMKMSGLLRPGGRLAFTTFGESNFAEIERIGATSLTYPAFEEIKAFGRQYFEVMHASREKLTLYFASPREILRHIHQTGVNANSHQIWGRSHLEEFSKRYEQFFQEQGYPLTYEPFYFVFERK